MNDTVRIKRLQISTHIGVPEEERAEAQQLCVSLEMEPKLGFAALNDEIEGGVDYYQVSLRVKELAAEKPRKLIETLAEDVAAMVLAEFAVCVLTVDVEKYILEDTDHVGVTIRRFSSQGATRGCSNVIV